MAAILVPVDHMFSPGPVIEQIIEASQALASKVVLLGVIPIHMYGRWEEKLVEKIRKDTAKVLHETRSALHKRGVATDEIVRFGYPDEEILKAADECSASMIIIPAGTSAPSELRKAADIILDEAEHLKSEVLLVTAE